YFFFSSRRRHTRSKRDWSSDVCSSDLSTCTIVAGAVIFGNTFITFSFFDIIKLLIVQFVLHWSFCCLLLLFYMLTNSATVTMVRSEERRVGKGGRRGWWGYREGRERRI